METRALRALPAVPLLLAAPLFSQQSFTSFKGFETTASDGFCLDLGIYPEGRSQYIFADYSSGGPAQQIKGMQFRLNTTYQRPNFGRSWTLVQIRFADSDFSRISDVWAKNMTSSPTLVFSAKATFPSSPSSSSSGPFPWGQFSKKGDMDFPFTTPYYHGGKASTVVDFQFSGGTLDNNATFMGQPYLVDGINHVSRNSWIAGRRSLHGSTSCRATGQSSVSYFRPWLFSEVLPDRALQHRWQWYARYLPADAVAAGVISLHGNATGTPWPGSCQQLYIDLGKPYVVHPFQVGPDGSHTGSFFHAPLVSTLVGKSIWTQAGFDDGSPARLQLTAAYQTIVPDPSGLRPTHWGSRLVHPDKNAPTGNGPYDTYLPLMLFY